MPYTEDQRRLFHVLTQDEDARKRRGVSRKEAQKLADEADKYAREGKEKPSKKAGEGFIDLSMVW